LLLENLLLEFNLSTFPQFPETPEGPICFLEERLAARLDKAQTQSKEDHQATGAPFWVSCSPAQPPTFGGSARGCWPAAWAGKTESVSHQAIER
jgi:hypothetical protein